MTHKQFNNVIRASIVMLFLMIAFTVQTFAQDKKLTADETYITRLKSSVKIETSNEAIFKLLQTRFKGEGLKYSVVTKKDRKGLYNQYTFSFKEDKITELYDFFEEINDKPKSK